MITDESLKDMAKFYLKEMFDDIPMIDVSFSEYVPDGVFGQFGLEKNDEYRKDYDELLMAYEYRPRYININNEILLYYDWEDSYEDPLNHPIPTIQISEHLMDEMPALTNTLLHELLHYYLWYIGWDFHDGTDDFERECARLGIGSHYIDEDPERICYYMSLYEPHIYDNI